MPSNTSDPATSCGHAVEIIRLTAPGIIGFFTHVEITEIFAVRDNEKEKPFNIFSILVLEEREDAIEQPSFLGERIRLRLLKGWTFGIQRTVRPVAALPTILAEMGAATWKPSGSELHLGTMAEVPRQFVPPDASFAAPWNNVLKNNFWCGSHVFEWSDTTKSAVGPLLNQPAALTALSEEIQKQIPLRLAALSDRLGNIAVQIPVIIVTATFGRGQPQGDALVDVAWDKRAVARPLRAVCERHFDGIVSGYASASVNVGTTALPMADGAGLQTGYLWDDANAVLLAATGQTGFINSIAMNTQRLDPEPRVFDVRSADGGVETKRVSVISAANETLIKGPTPDRGETWVRRRIYSDDRTRLAEDRRLLQYRPMSHEINSQHEQALNDIRHLINKHGARGAWLWDPYLSGEDILETLFYCRHANADLRALTQGVDPPAGLRVTVSIRSIAHLIVAWLNEALLHKASTQPSFAERQRDVLNAASDKPHGLRLEYRERHGNVGWAFHDRFLIFPRSGIEGALAWSLGTSVNSLGKNHHILQQVDNGQLIADAFLELWDALNAPGNLVWKTP